METKENCKVLLKNGKTQKVKCHKFFHKELKRELAVHEDVDNKNKTSITDVETGYGLRQFDKEIKKVTETDVDETLIEFIKHYTIEVIKDKFKETDNRDTK